MFFKKIQQNKNHLFFHKLNNIIITGCEFKHQLKEALKYIGIKPKYSQSRAPSLRYGDLTDLYAASVHYTLIQKYASHVTKSRSTYLHTKIETREKADLVAQNLAKYF